MKHFIISEYLSNKFELTLHNPKKQNDSTTYNLLYKGWCPVGRCVETTSQFMLIIGYFACYVDNLTGSIRLTTSQGEIIDDNVTWKWIVGAIQMPCRNESY
jgi:hypothetical protein